jgi:hypothetical protein
MAIMAKSRDTTNTEDDRFRASVALGELIHTAEKRGLTIGRAITIGRIKGVIIGYNIARDGNFPGSRYPLLVSTALGTGKFAVDEVSLD